MHPARHIPRYTYNDYLLWEGDWEMIEGIPYAMSPSPTTGHQKFSLFLSSEILTSVNKKNRDKCRDCIILQDVDWIIDDYTVLRPDIAVVCHHDSDFITSPPVLIVEILSPSTAHKDRLIKYEIYEEQKVKYYIIADPLSGTYSCYHLIESKYQEYKLDKFTIHDGCVLTVDIAKVLAEAGK